MVQVSRHQSVFAGIVCLLVLLSGCGNNAGLTIANSVAQISGGYDLTENLEFGPNDRNSLDIYVPNSKEEGELLPVVVFFYGGCWGGCFTGSKKIYPFIGQAIANESFIAVIPDYRIHPNVKFPAIIEDAAKAVKWVHNNIQQYGGDTSKIFVMGHSAGAHIASMLSLNPLNLERVGGSRDWIAGFIGLAGPYDFDLNKSYQKQLFGPPENYPLSQPVNFVTRDAPPMLLLHGQQDARVNKRNSNTLGKKIRDLGGNAIVRLYDDIDHTGIISVFSVFLRSKAPVITDISDFVNEQSRSGLNRSGLSRSADKLNAVSISR